MRQTRQAVCAIKQSILLRCLWFGLTYFISMDLTCIIDVYGLDFPISHPWIQLILFGVSQLDSLISFFVWCLWVGLIYIISMDSPQIFWRLWEWLIVVVCFLFYIYGRIQLFYLLSMGLTHLFHISERYFKRHPTTKFNKTPSAKYILL